MIRNILALILVMLLYSCKKNSEQTITPVTNTCTNRHSITLKFGIKVSSSITYIASYYVGTNPRPFNIYLPISNGKIVFSNGTTEFEGCDCVSNGKKGTELGYPRPDLISFGALSNSTTPFTAYIMLDTDTIFKKQSYISTYGGSTVDVNPPFSGCLTNL